LNAIEMNQTFIVAAYAVTWVVILGYLARLGRKSARSRAAYHRMAGGEGGSAR
jgi:CcmD family protein